MNETPALRSSTTAPVHLRHQNWSRKESQEGKGKNGIDRVETGNCRENGRSFSPDLIRAALGQDDGSSREAESVRRIGGESEHGGKEIGYDENFLGATNTVPLPKPMGEAGEQVLHFGRNGEWVRKYTHFSIVMSKERKVAMFTADNLDGASLRDDVKRGKWQIDEVIGSEHQLSDSLYSGSALTRGHMVRRRDVVWGSREEAERANDATFNYPNAVPQHGELNCKKWNDLENWLLERARKQDQKLCVFTGPVLADDDVSFRGEKIPADFWKIVVLERESDHKLAAAAFVMSQRDLLRNLDRPKSVNSGSSRGSDGMVETDAVAPYQVSIDEIEKNTNLDFGDLKDVDAFALFQEVISKAANSLHHQGGSPGSMYLAQALTIDPIPALSRRCINSAEDIII
jgi:endonuclease G, mitochondrial